MILTVNQTNRVLARSGVYAGSIGAGGFEVRPDGKFYRCRISNDWKTDPAIDVCLLYQYNNRTYNLSLGDINHPSWIIPGVKSVKYTGEFPKIKLQYPGLPVELEFTSFFVPGDIKNPSLPAVSCRVKGKGKLAVLFPSLLPASPHVDGQKVSLKSDKGTIALHSAKGKMFFTQNVWCIYQHHLDLIKLPDPVPAGTTVPADKYNAGAYFEDKFNDELIIAWHYPDMQDFENNLIGHNYSNHFNSCDEVMDYVLQNKTLLHAAAAKFHDSVYGKKNKLPSFVKDSYSAQMSSFVKQSWLTKDGKFGVWEGSCNCCGLQTTDVAYYGSWLYVTMFPDLEKSGMRLLAKFQHESGWIPHFFPGTFTHIDQYRRKDMNMQYVLMAYRDYYLWKDKKFLAEIYPVIKKTINNVYSWDTDGDKIPELEGPDQTFDAWGWKGCSSYLASLWLGTLRAGVEFGNLMNDVNFAAQCKADYITVQQNMIKKLWAKDHFILWTDEPSKTKDDSCLIDALSGDWYCYLSGLGHILPDDMIKSHLAVCWKRNRKKVDTSYMKTYCTAGEQGWCYINGGYKTDKRVSFQQYEPWTGTEYAYAVHLLIMGMKKQAVQVIKDIFDRKLVAGMTWNHYECGGDYYRPMVFGLLYDLLTTDKQR